MKAIKKPISFEFLELKPTWTSIREAYQFIHSKPPYKDNASDYEKDKFCDWMDYCIHQGFMPIKTLESGDGTQNANFGDYILKGIQGECWPIKPDIFKATYDILD